MSEINIKAFIYNETHIPLYQRGKNIGSQCIQLFLLLLSATNKY